MSMSTNHSTGRAAYVIHFDGDVGYIAREEGISELLTPRCLVRLVPLV